MSLGIGSRTIFYRLGIGYRNLPCKLQPWLII